METTCPKCRYTRTAADTAPSGECPKCGVIYAKVKTDKQDNASTVKPEAIRGAKSDPATPERQLDSYDTKQKKALIVTLVIGLTIGYFAGREHIKYQMRSALTEAVVDIKNTLGAAFGNNKAKGSEEKKSQEKVKKIFPITVALVDKGWREGEYGQSSITFAIRITNSTGKDVRAFDGVLEFTDLLGNEILVTKLAINDPVISGQTLDWKGTIEYNQFMDQHRVLRYADQQNIKVRFTLQKTLFSDGTVKDF